MGQHAKTLVSFARTQQLGTQRVMFGLLYVCTLTHIGCTELGMCGPWSELIADGT